MKIFDFARKKANHEKISMITCYDYTSACIVAQTSVDCILIGDSVAMTMHGYNDTLAATVDMISLHTAAVRRGAADIFIVSDMPFLSNRFSLSKSVAAAQKLMQAGANALKIECAAGNLKLIRHLTEAGVPVMGHLGLTPQSLHMLGGWRAQGKTPASALQIQKDALSLQQAGCFALVLECVPSQLAKEITDSLSIPTIGVGAGPHTDGQVLVFQDMLGLNSGHVPRFVKAFVDGKTQFKLGIEAYIHELKNGGFPSHEHCYAAE